MIRVITRFFRFIWKCMKGFASVLYDTFYSPDSYPNNRYKDR